MLIRYGCWSEETLSMKLPSYRNHFLLLTTISMEAVHDYLTMRLEGRPDHPSCLTVKQVPPPLIWEAVSSTGHIPIHGVTNAQSYDQL